MKYFLIIIFNIIIISFPTYADQKTDYFAKNCYKSSIGSLDYLIKGTKFSTSFKYGKIQTKEAFYPSTQEDRLVCELNQGSCQATYTMKITVYEIFAWGEEKSRRHKCYFNENGSVTRVE
jgi:hypothetical protein